MYIAYIAFVQKQPPLSKETYKNNGRYFNVDAEIRNLPFVNSGTLVSSIPYKMYGDYVPSSYCCH